MAYDQHSAVKELRALNVVPMMAEEPLISPASLVASPSPNSARDLLYSPAGAWCVRPVAAARPAAIGFNHGNGFGNSVVLPGNAVNLGNWPVANGSSNDGGTPNNGSPHGSSRCGGDDGGDDSVSGRKVKFLCSFGGRILPRPSDGVLRYVGGQTRIIGVRKDVCFDDLMQKMVDTYGQPVAIKYQLPEEELDALVSVSCPDDVENMMEEYDKLVERSPDGSGKLRVFLFSASELDLSGVMQSGDLQDTGQRYFDAVNGITDGNGINGGIQRKGSITSAASTQNSDLSGIETIDSSFSSQWEPVSSVVSSKENVAASPDTRANLVVSEPNSAVYSPATVVSPGMPVAMSSPINTTYSQNEVELYGMENPHSSPYLQPLIDLRSEVRNHADYVQLPPQAGFSNPQFIGNTGPSFTQQQFCDNTPGLAFHQVISGAQMAVSQPYSHAAVSPNFIQQQTLMQQQQNRLDQYNDENAPGVRIVQLPSENNYNAYRVSGNQVPSVIAGGNYGWVHVPQQEQVVFSDGLLPQQQVLIPEKIQRVEGCSMCQTKLPHAHSDPVVQDQHNGGASPVPDSSPIYRSFPVEDIFKSQATNRFKPMVTAPLESILENGAGTGPRLASKVEPLNGEPCTNNARLSHNLVPRPEVGNNCMQKPEEFDHPRNSFLQETNGRASGKQFHNDGLSMATPLSYPEAIHPNVPGENQVKQDILVSKPVNNDISMVDRKTIQTSECMTQGSPKEYANEYTSVVSKSDAVDNWIRQDHLKSVDGRMDTLKICNPENVATNDHCFMAVEKPNGNDKLDYNIQSSVEGEVILDNNFCRPKLVVDSNQIKMTGVLPCSSGAVSFQHNSRTGEHNEVARPLVLDIHHSDSQPKIGNPLKDDLSSSSLSSSVRLGDVHNSSNSLFSNQDPWSIQHSTFFPPARASNTTLKKETYSPRDHFGETPGSFGKHISETQLDEGLYESFTQNLTFEHSHSTKGSTEEQQLQAVAEDVAASVFQPCTPSNPNLHARDVSSRENIEDSDIQNNLIDVMCRNKTLDVKSKPPEKASFGFPASGVGRLQVIKNCHLEELTELGSGTFGTVYHGKWRGTDVAIKRITDRCFAGKPSEQERMRDDFWNEAIKLADLHHPNVVAFYGVVLDGPGGSVATVTEYMANGSLRNALQKSERNLDKRRRLFVAMDVAFGMEYLHGKNIVHFDLKSDNLLVNLRDPHRPICKVGDLGLSKVKCQTLISGGVRGTLPWMAPELLNGSSSLVSEKVDVFSYGIVMWELLTGEEPYADLHYGAIIGGIVSNTLRPPVPESCDPEWRFLMERCWSSEPSERPGFPEIVNELRSMATKRPNQQLHPSPLQTQVPTTALKNT